MLAELTCKPVEIGDYAWIGAGATVLPGVRVGRHAVVGAASVITKDVPSKLNNHCSHFIIDLRIQANCGQALDLLVHSC